MRFVSLAKGTNLLKSFRWTSYRLMLNPQNNCELSIVLGCHQKLYLENTNYSIH